MTNTHPVYRDALSPWFLCDWVAADVESATRAPAIKADRYLTGGRHELILRRLYTAVDSGVSGLVLNTLLQISLRSRIRQP